MSETTVRPTPEIDYSNLTRSQQRALRSYCDACVDAYKRDAAPIEPSDPRYESMSEYDLTQTPDEIGDLWARLNSEPPAWSVPVPSWAESALVEHDSFPLVLVKFERAFETPTGARAEVSQLLSIDVATATVIDVHEPEVYFDERHEMDLAAASAAVDVLQRATAVLRSFEEAKADEK